MAEQVADRSAKIFHESWYRIASQRASLRSSVRIHRQFYRGVKWYVLFDPFTNQYYRLEQGAWEFVVRLDSRRTIEEVWYELLRLDPDNAPGQGEVIDILAQLYQANMLHYDLAQDGQKLFERKQRKDQQKLRSNLLNILFLRIPLLDPDSLLKRFMPLIRLLFSRAGLLVWLAVVGTGVKFALDNFDRIKDQAQGVLAPSNLFLLYICGFLIKVIHETGHACAVRRHGGEVHAMGVMFMMLAPLPYTDATASWSFRSKAQRVLVASSGMLFEFFVAGLAAIAWTWLGGGAAKSVAYNVLFLASVTTILFNINPLMKFDGYYILADLLDMPNLQKHAGEHLKHLLERYAFGKHDSRTPARSMRDAWIFGLYGILSHAYKFLLFGGILITISQHYMLLAVVMGALILLTWVAMPLWKFVRYVFFGPELQRVRPRAVRTTLLSLGGLFATLAWLPVPDTFTAPGVVQAQVRTVVVAQTSGRVTSCHPSTRQVRPGDTLLQLVNPELDDRIDQTRSQLSETADRFRQALEGHPEDMMPIDRRREALEQELSKLLQDRRNLSVLATQAGIWSSPRSADLEGKWMVKGDSLGEVIDTSRFDFVAAIAQSEVSRLFTHPPRDLEARIKGHAGESLPLDSLRVIPMERNELPSLAISWQGGGELEVAQGPGGKIRTVEPFYEVRAHLAPTPGVPLLQGRSGKIRFVLGWSPLLPQLWRKLRQELQKYYRV
ncbi:MAG: hypothetical protein RL318_753 [Fibrobacterota bacterium]